MNSHHTLLFVRQGRNGIENAAIVKLVTSHEKGAEEISTEEAKARFVAACTEWMRETPAGQRAWAVSSRDFNIGDFLNDGVRHDKEFQALCEKYKIIVDYADSVPFEATASYDEVLCDDERMQTVDTPMSDEKDLAEEKVTPVTCPEFVGAVEELPSGDDESEDATWVVWESGVIEEFECREDAEHELMAAGSRSCVGVLFTNHEEAVAYAGQFAKNQPEQALLLDACKTALDFFKSYFPLEHGNPELGKAWGKLEAAIAQNTK